MNMNTSRTVRFHRAAIATACSALIAMCIAPAPAAAQDEPAAVDFRPAWQPGQTARYEVWTQRERESTMSVGGETQQVNMTLESEGEVTWTVDRVEPDGSAVCTMTIDWLATTVTDAEGQAQVNDSRRASGDIEPMHQVLRAMAGVPVRVHVGVDGAVQRVEGIDAIARAVEIAELAPDENDFIRSATHLAVLADAPADARAGHTWNARHTWNHEAGQMQHSDAYTLQSVGEIAGVPVATVVSRTQLELDVDRSVFPDDGPPVDVQLTEGTRSAEVIFDLQRREAVGRNSLERTTVQVNVRLPEQTLNQRNRETVRSQALRIAEE
ncbi:MAG: hypothetical protein WD118_07785 [Phycisphaeraceae bacterium]